MQMFIHQYKNHITAISLILIVVAFLLGGSFKSVFLLTATLIAGIPIAMNAYQAIKYKVFSMELLVTIAVAGAIFIGEYVESAVVTFLFLFGDYLEGRTLEKTRSSIKELTDMAPKEAIVLRDGVQKTISVEEVVEGDHLIIYSGGEIPVDGKIIAGSAHINESMVTGESIPAFKGLHDEVFSGTMLDNGYMEMIAEKTGDDTTFAKMVRLVEEAQESKTKTEKFLNKFANIYTPAIVVLSIIVYIFTRDLHIAITFLVIACPGALIIGAPVSSVAGLGNGAKNGVFIKGGEVMDTFSKVDTVIFDKTGTLTKGQPVVTDVKVFTDEGEGDIFRLIANAETISEHHLGKTIVKEAVNRGLDISDVVANGKIMKGNGISGTVENRELVIGSRRWIVANQIGIPKIVKRYVIGQEGFGNTVVYAAVDGILTAVVSVADEIREDAHRAISNLRKNGMKKIVMLTGDNRLVAKMVSEQLGLDEYYAELLPEDKVEHVKRMKEKGHIIAMAGDGINDAPAIATADIGVAMGEGGTDVAMETADVVLMADRLMQFAHAFSLSMASIRNMKQNTFFAVGTVFILLIGVLGGYVHLASGMFIHEASVLLVILNGMRLLTFNRKGLNEEAKYRAGKKQKQFASSLK